MYRFVCVDLSMLDGLADGRLCTIYRRIANMIYDSLILLFSYG